MKKFIALIPLLLIACDEPREVKWARWNTNCDTRGFTRNTDAFRACVQTEELIEAAGAAKSSADAAGAAAGFAAGMSAGRR